MRNNVYLRRKEAVHRWLVKTGCIKVYKICEDPERYQSYMVYYRPGTYLGMTAIFVAMMIADLPTAERILDEVEDAFQRLWEGIEDFWEGLMELSEGVASVMVLIPAFVLIIPLVFCVAVQALYRSIRIDLQDRGEKDGLEPLPAEEALKRMEERRAC